MSDVFSKDVVIECVYKALRIPPLKGVFTDTMSLAISMVNDLSSAQPEPHWIPCKERLPEKEIDVLCCRDNKSMAIMHFNPVLTTRYPKGFSVVEDSFSWRQDNVIAWMTLPEPYHDN